VKSRYNPSKKEFMTLNVMLTVVVVELWYVVTLI
jgi:hypothetical protein